MRGCLRKEESMSEENKALIRRLYEEVWNQHNPEAADECCVDVHRDVHLIVEVVDLQDAGIAEIRAMV
jgi:hypothetical protein